MNINHYCLFIFLITKIPIHSFTVVHDVKQATFINPQTNTALVRCPLKLKPNFQIQWFDVVNNRYEKDHGINYYIHGLQSIDRILICSSTSDDGLETSEKYRIQVRVYDHPLPVWRIFISKATTASLTVLWNDDEYNENANITGYDLILKRNNTILHRILVNNTQSNYTFLSLNPNILYTIEISAVDSWKRYSQSKKISGPTLLSNITENISSHKIIDRYVLDQSLSCYNLNAQLLLIEFNRSQFRQLNYLYNLTVYNNNDHIVLTDSLYSARQKLPLMKTSNSFVYGLKDDNFRYKIKLIVSTVQLEYLGMIDKYCEDFFPIYSPLTCSLKLMKQKSYHLTINMHLYNNNKHIISLKPNNVFYQLNQQLFMKRSIDDIHKYATATIIDVMDNYSVIVENDLIGSKKNDRLNISILCSMNRSAPDVQNGRMSISIIIIFILLTIIFLALIVFIAYQQGVLSICHRILLHRVSSLRKNHDTNSCLIRANHCTDKSIDDTLDVFKDYYSTDVPIEQFGSYVTCMHKDDNFGFVRLFENIVEFSKTLRISVDAAQNEHNLCKNRYVNILTYDHSRVKLLSDHEQGRGSYINANYVDGFGKKNAYIATQGPMINTINDFWRMIWEKDVTVLVMITNIKECGRIKCDMYWPQEGTVTYGIIEVTLVKTISLAYYAKRIFAIRCVTDQQSTGQKRLLYQFHYTNWPDHGVPLFTLPVLSFIRVSSACNADTNGPIVVHCSAGVGRTGTYIVIDTMLKKIDRNESLDIPSFLKHIRQQRNFLVQTEEQFIFIYDVLKEATQLAVIGYNSLELNADNIDAIQQTLEQYDEDSNLMQIEKQFRLILEQPKINNRELSVAQMKENFHKNRSQSVVPLNPCRVTLSNDRKQVTGEYINASYAHGYYRVDEFIITQHPMVNTIVDFWRMVWNNSVDVIVSLYADEKLQSDIPDFWPSKNQLIDCGSFTVYLGEERFEYEYIYREILFRSIEGNYECKAKLISSTYWPDTCSPIKTTFNLINRIRTLKPTGPIVVHDLFGGYRAATFCSLYTMKEQIEAENSLNVFELAKFYYLKRPGIWRNHNDLLFLYRCAESLFHDYKLLSYDGPHLSDLPS